MAIKPNFLVEYVTPPLNVLAMPFKVWAPTPEHAVAAIAHRQKQDAREFVARPIIETSYRVIG